MAFASNPFQGNPAVVFLLKEPLDDELMQKIASEMNLSETAFLLLRKEQKPFLRWFTPMCEIDLCGHATMATAQIYFTEIRKDLQEVTFATKFVGDLKVTRSASLLKMDFPARPGEPIAINEIPSFVTDSLSVEKPLEAKKSRDLMLIYKQESIIRNMKPNFHNLLKYPDFIIVTAPSQDPQIDFVSRFFCASDGILEDPVTGSSHCTLAPYWSEKLKKKHLKAYQASERGGWLNLDLKGDRVQISGEAITLLKGVLYL